MVLSPPSSGAWMTTTVEPMTLKKHPTFPWRLSLSCSSWEERTALEAGRGGREGGGEEGREGGRGERGRERGRRKRERKGKRTERGDGGRLGHCQTALCGSSHVFMKTSMKQS